MFKIKLYCEHNHELKKITNHPYKKSLDEKHKSLKNERLLCDNCNEYKSDDEIEKGIYHCDICCIDICQKCIIERFNLHFV